MQAVIIAAGESSRFWPLNKEHKSLLKVMGRPLILHTIGGLKQLGIKDIIVVQGPKKDIKKELETQKECKSISYVVQPKPEGTGDALWRAKKFIKESFVAVGPHKIDLATYLPALLKKYRQGPKTVLTGVKTDSPWDYGIFEFRKNKIVKIIENPQRGKEPSNIKATETYIFQPSFFDYLKKVPLKEDNLIDAINLSVKERGAGYVLLKEESASLKYPWHLFKIMEMLFESKKFKPSISKLATIGKNVIIRGKVHIGDNTIVKDNTVIEGPAHIEDGCEIGPFNVLRGPLNLERGVKTGAFCEIKHSVIQEGTHFHSGYVGDSIIGKNCRVGAGFVAANRRLDRKGISVTVKEKKVDTGLTYLGATIGDNTSIGIHSGTMPGVLIGSNCVIGSGVQVFENVSDGKKVFNKRA